MKKMSVFLMLLVSLFVFELAAEKAVKEVKKEKKQTICPVMGGKINKKFYIDVKGKRIYVCCPGCTKLIKKNPDKYIKKLESKGVVLDKAPKEK